MVEAMNVVQIGMVAVGAIQGFLLTRTWAVGRWLQKTLGGKAVKAPDLKFRLFAILLAVTPSLIWIAAADSPSPQILGARFVAGMSGGLLLGMLTVRPISDDPIRAALLVQKRPTVAVFGRFASEDRELDDLLKCLRDKEAKRLWRKFQAIAVDLDKDPEMLAKYGVDPALGLQAIFFAKDGAKLEIDGEDRIFAGDILDPLRLANCLQTALNQWDAAAATQRPGT